MMDMSFVIIVPAEGIAGIDIKDGLHALDGWNLEKKCYKQKAYCTS